MHTLINFLRSFASLIPMVSILLFFSPHAEAQNRPLSDWIEASRQNQNFNPVTVFTPGQVTANLSSVVRHAEVLNLNEEALDGLLHTAPNAMTLQIPRADGSMIELELAQVNILAPGFRVGVLGAFAQENVPVHRSVHYQGIIKGDPNSVAAISLTSSGLMGMFADDSGNWQIGELEDRPGSYILYRSADLLKANEHACFTDDATMNLGGTEAGAEDRSIGCKTVTVYFECDYKLFQDKGSSVNNVNNYVTSLFNQISALYVNENVSVAISEIYVWSSPDPYQSYTSTATVLNAFKANKGTNFNGNLAHFLSSRSLGGGIAYVDVICVKSFAFGVSGIQTSFQNVPTYSWSVEVVTHELGHNLGSWHTQSCNWPGGAIDNCVNTEGGCAPGPAPVGGGTIMSYCHLTSNGINFNYGFGPLPGNKIRDRVLASTCIQQNPGNPPVNLNISNITGASAILSWDPVPGAAIYTIQYKLSNSNNWTTAGTSGTATYNLSGLSANQNYDWQVKTDCSSYSTPSSFSTNSSGGGGNGGGGTNCTPPANLAAGNVTANSANLSWDAVSGATDYSVEYKLGSSTTWSVLGTYTTTAASLSGLLANMLYHVQVKANCSAFGSALSFSTLNSGGGGSGCSAPGNLTASAITSSTVTLSWAAVSGATNYTVQYKKSTATSWFVAGTVSTTTTNLQSLTAGTDYHWRVKADCSAYTSNALFTTSLSNGGGGPVLVCSAPTNLTNVFIGATNAVIRWGAVSGAQSYTLQIKRSSSNVWFTLGIVPVTQVTLTGMSPNTSYQWRVKANCSGYSTPMLLVTPSSLQSDGTEALDNPTLSYETGVLELYPNPTASTLNIRYVQEGASKHRYMIVDASGKIVVNQELFYSEQAIDVSRMASGVYMLLIYDEQRRVAEQRFVKQ